MKIKEIMREKVVTVFPETKVKDIAKLLLKHDITGVPVVSKENQVVGIVTEADLIMQYSHIHFPLYIQILDSTIYLENPAKIEQELKKIAAVTASDLMTKNVYTISPEDKVEDLANLIKDKHINPIPVTKGKKLVGIVSRADLVKLLAK